MLYYTSAFITGYVTLRDSSCLRYKELVYIQLYDMFSAYYVGGKVDEVEFLCIIIMQVHAQLCLLFGSEGNENKILVVVIICSRFVSFVEEKSYYVETVQCMYLNL